MRATDLYDFAFSEVFVCLDVEIVQHDLSRDRLIQFAQFPSSNTFSWNETHSCRVDAIKLCAQNAPLFLADLGGFLLSFLVWFPPLRSC